MKIVNLKTQAEAVISVTVSTVHMRKNSGVEEFKNGSKLSGDLRSQNVATGTTIDNILSKESTGIPIYVLTVKIDKTATNKAVTDVYIKSKR